MLKTYVIYYRYKVPDEKARGQVRHYKICATNLEEARRLAREYANYPNIELIDVKST